MKYLCLILVAFSFFLTKTISLFGFPQHYQIVDLGLQKYSSSNPTSINNQGWITGLLSDNGYETIFVLDENRQAALRRQSRTSSHLTINNHNEIFGSAIYRASSADWIYDEEQIFKWINPFKYWQYFHFYYLGCPKGQYSNAFKFKTNVVWDANDLGQLIVMDCNNYSEATSEFHKGSVWIYDKDTFYKLEHPQFQAGFKINNHSQILGSYMSGSALTKDRREHVMLWDYNANKLRQIKLPGNATGSDLNDLGQVVGIFYHPDEEMWMGFLAEPTKEIIGMINFYPQKINNRGEMIGTYLYGEKQDQPALWDQGDVHSITEYLSNMKDDKGNTWDSIERIIDINDDGIIIGQGKINGKTHALMLQPIESVTME